MNKSNHPPGARRQELFKPIEPHPDFVQMEEELLKRWYRDGVVKKYLAKNAKARKRFSFLDGPITANNPMGVHHARGRTYKDLWQRYHTLRGHQQRYQNGFDCQGLWVEVEVEKELNFKSKKDILDYGVEKFINQCKERVLKYAAVQTEQSKRLGMFMDWDNSYFTMSDENNYAIWNFLKVCHQRGWIYQGPDSVPWCPRCETAISQHEMLTEDYKETTHESIYLALPLKSEGEYLLVWTTTPWTIPANIAVAVDEKLDYSLVEASGKRYWVANDAVKRIFSENGRIRSFRVRKDRIPGKELVGLKYRGPFDHLPAVKKVAQENPSTFHSVIATDNQILSISTSEGTGLVHTAVSAGTEDFKLGKKYGLPMIPVIADNADYLPGLGFLSGKNAKKHPELILDYLKDQDKKSGQDWVFKIENYPHRYPVCWRCKTELVWKVTNEWYIAMDRPSLKASDGKSTLREQLVEVTKKINWIPGFGLERELDWLKNMHDWLISKKNRFWGLALPIWKCSQCQDFEVIGSQEELRKKAVAGWSKFKGHTPHKPWIDEVKIKCANCREVVSRVEPVGNPWLDAGIVSFSTMPGRPDNDMDGWFPADFITEAFPGQFKNWFYSLLVMATVLKKTNPFKTVLGFESVVGEDGRPMHKSWGNAIEFNQGAKKIGVDVMRWMYAQTPPEALLPFGYQRGDEIRRRFLLILWNSYRFFVSQANSDGWRAPAPSSKLQTPNSVLDRWILSRLNEAIIKVTQSLDQYQSAPATEVLESLTNDFSTWYIRRSRDRVGVTASDSEDKNNAYSTMHFVLVQLTKLLAPFMPYVTDTIYRNLTGEESVHLADWPHPLPAKWRGKPSKKVLEQMKLVREIATLGHAQRKAAGLKLRQPLAWLVVKGLSLRLLQGQSFKDLKALLMDELNVKEVRFKKSKKDKLKVELDTALTDDLKKEGQARDLIRTIQHLRREAKVDLGEQVVIGLPDWPKEFEEEIKRATLARRIEKSKQPLIK